MIRTWEQAAAAALDFLRQVPTPQRPGIVEVVGLGDRWRVFYGWVMKVDLPGRPGMEIAIQDPIVVPLTVDAVSGEVGVEWPLQKTESTARDALRLLQVEHVEPLVRSLGLRGSKGRYDLPSTTHFATIGFTSSRRSNSAVCFFDVVAQVLSREGWSVEVARGGRGRRPDLNVLYTFGSTWALSGGMGWTLYAGAPIEPLADQVLRAIEAAVPEIRRLVAAESPDGSMG